MQKLLPSRFGANDNRALNGSRAGAEAMSYTARFSAREAAIAIYEANFEDMSKYAPEYSALLAAIENERILGRCRAPIYRAESKAATDDNLSAAEREDLLDAQRERLVREIEAVLVREVTKVRANKPDALSMVKIDE